MRETKRDGCAQAKRRDRNPECPSQTNICANWSGNAGTRMDAERRTGGHETGGPHRRDSWETSELALGAHGARAFNS